MKPGLGQSSLFGAAEPTPAVKRAVCYCGKQAPRTATGLHKVCEERDARKRDPDVQAYHRLFDHYVTEFERERGESPIITDRDRVAIKRAVTVLLPQVSEDRLRQLITTGIKCGATISYIVAEPSKFQGQAPRRGARRIQQASYTPEPDPWDLKGRT